MTKELLIITLILIVIYFYYQQNTQPTLIQPHNQEVQELKSQLNHYQTLYQKRVAKDLEADQSEKISKLTANYQQLENNLSQEIQTKNLYQQKIGSLENQ